MKHTFFLLCIFCLVETIGAQTTADALRFSQMEVTGTARAIGVGGGLGALGADFSVLSTNPAGLAAFRKSEFIITPALFGSKVDATLTSETIGNRTNTERDGKFILNNVGVIVTSSPIASNWKTVNFGIGINQLANFNRELYYEGSSIGSITDRFLEQANGLGLNDFESGVAYDAGALYGPDNEGFYQSDFEFAPNAFVQKNQRITSSGSVNELVFSLAANYNEKLMFGATLGVPFLSFTQNKTYQEIDPFSDESPDGEIPYFDELEYRENLTTTGVGINLKAGIIYRLSQAVRFGAAIHTPTAYSFQDNFTTEMDYAYLNDNGDVVDATGYSPDGLFDYKFATPFRALGNAGFIFGKNGFLSAEVEWVDYGSGSFNLTSDSDNAEDAAYEKELNKDISSQFRSALNFRVGGELAWNMLRFRAGVGLLGSPYAGDTNFNTKYSLGAGLRLRNFFLDAAYQLLIEESGYIPYLTTNAPQQLVNTKSTDSRIVLTLGFKF